VVLLAAAQHNLEVHSYAPRSEGLRGRPRPADKRQMQMMVRALLSMRRLRTRRRADALAVGRCATSGGAREERFGLRMVMRLVRPRALGAAAGAPGVTTVIRTGGALEISCAHPSTQ